MNWHTLETDQLLADLSVDPTQGLTNAEAAQRLAERAMAALKRLAVPTVRVRRGGMTEQGRVVTGPELAAMSAEELLGPVPDCEPASAYEAGAVRGWWWMFVHSTLIRWV